MLCDMSRTAGHGVACALAVCWLVCASFPLLQDLLLQCVVAAAVLARDRYSLAAAAAAAAARLPARHG
jgi:hypothetical protein